MKKAIFALEREKKILKGPTKFCVKAFCSPVYPIKTIVKGCWQRSCLNTFFGGEKEWCDCKDTI